ncbi:fungal specific transcription factor domain-containing protein [Paraphaeosphaeria sporulosa]
MSPSDPSPQTGRVRKRAAEACAFCRRRKIKCSSERPTCAACKTHGTTCSYENADDARQPKSAPRDYTPGHLSDAVTASASTHPLAVPVRERLSHHSVERETPPSNSVSRIVTANGMSSYHGRTSTLFDENADRSTVERRPSMPEEWVEKGLLAEATRQRQLEDFHFRNKTLDFDGVEPELGMHLLSLHWNRQHHSFLITYRPAFMRDMASGGKGPYFSKLLLNAIYFGASKFSPRHEEVRRVPNDVRTAGWKFRQRVRELLGEALEKCEITTIQALLVMTNSLFALGDERSAAWVYAGIAFRMIVDLGLHVDTLALASTGTRKISDEDYEIRRRVFWAAFVVDKIQSLYQGRPVSIKESDTLVPIKFLDSYEELEQWAPFAYSAQSSAYLGSPAYSVSTFRQLCMLSIILEDILSSIYTERSHVTSPGDLSSKLQNIHEKLTSWRSSLPTHLAFDTAKTSAIPPPHVLSLHAMYNVLTILLHRPFVTDGHLYNTSRAISINSFMICATAADSIVLLLRAYDKAFSVGRAPYLISYATYVAATIHVRIAAKRGASSHARSNLEACLDVFRKNEETNWAVRRANAIVQNLMRRLGIESSPPEKLGDGIATGNTRDSPDVSAYQSIGREQSLQSLDIDDIIQTFIKEQESFQPTHLPSESRNSFGDIHPPATTRYSTFVDNSGAHTGQENGFDIPNTYQGNPYPMPAGASVTVDDLLYGLNGSAMDSFAFLDWDPAA